MLTINTNNHLCLKISTENLRRVTCLIAASRVHVVTLVMKCLSDDWRVKIIALLFLFVIILICIIITATTRTTTPHSKMKNNFVHKLLFVMNTVINKNVMMKFTVALLLPLLLIVIKVIRITNKTAKNMNCLHLHH